MGVNVSDVLIRVKEILNQPGVWIRWRVFDKGRAPAVNPQSWEERDSPYGGPQIYEYDGSQKGQHCLLGAVIRAKHELGVDNNDTSASDLLGRLAPEVAAQHGKPLDVGKRAQYRRNRQHNAAWFNNTAESMDEINDLLCEGIKEAVEQEEPGASK